MRKIIFTVLFLFLLIACTKEEGSSLIEFTGLKVANITVSNADVSFEISGLNGDFNDFGVVYNVGQNASEGIKVSMGKPTDKGDCLIQLEDLNTSETYCVCAYGCDGNDYTYSAEVEFSTLDGLPILSTNTVYKITDSTATSGGTIINDKGLEIIAKGVCWSTEENPTINDNKTDEGKGPDTFISNILGLDARTTYYVRAYATSIEGTGYGINEKFTSDRPNITGQIGVIVDYDKNTYNWVGIGKQAWMAENLKVTHFSNGKSIPYVTDDNEWENLNGGYIDPAYCYYNNDSTSHTLYTCAAAKEACPAGWHLPKSSEWHELNDFVDANMKSESVSIALKAISSWTDGTNEFGFAAVPNGYRSSEFVNGYSATWWGYHDNTNAPARVEITNHSEQIKIETYTNTLGLSVRCVRD